MFQAGEGSAFETAITSFHITRPVQTRSVLMRISRESSFVFRIAFRRAGELLQQLVIDARIEQGRQPETLEELLDDDGESGNACRQQIGGMRARSGSATSLSRRAAIGRVHIGVAREVSGSTLLSGGSIFRGVWMSLFVSLFQTLGAYMRVNLSCRQTLVAQQFLNGP